MKYKQLSYYIEKYFSEYLPTLKGVSSNTILSYRDTFVLLLNYLHDKKNMNINKLKTDSIDDLLIENFLEYLENERNNSVSTRNQRLASIHSFYRYLQQKELSCYDLCSHILSIPIKKTPSKTISYFSVEELTILIKKPNNKTKKGFRDYVLLFFMYESAARAQELCDLKIGHFTFGEHPSVIITGKGNKSRVVPLTVELSRIILKYIDIFNLIEKDYVFQNKANQKLTTKGVEYILNKYVKLCKISNPDKFKNHYSNHSMRHSRAMHLLESGVNLIYIRDILGHTTVVTTEIYAKTNPVIKEKQILEHSKRLNIKDRYSDEQKEDLLSFLKKMI